jgi:hypothetical protein
MRVAVILGVLFCIALIAGGAYWALLEQRQVESYSARTTGVVLSKKLERQLRPLSEMREIGPDRFRVENDDPFRYRPIVSYRYVAVGRPYKGSSIFPADNSTFIGGNLGRITVEATLERFEVGERTAVYYDPENPWKACLVRRPALGPYFTILGPVVGASVLISVLWPAQGARDSRRRKGRGIVALWYSVGVVAAVHYVWVAGANCSGLALAALGIYLQVGLVPLMFALPPAKRSPWLQRLKGAFGLSLAGTFIGLWLGMLIGWIAMTQLSGGATAYLQCWGYAMAIMATLFALLGLTAEWHIGNGGKASREKPAPVETSRSAEIATSVVKADGRIPFRLDERPMPSGADLEELLPVEVGSFRRGTLDDGAGGLEGPIYAQYSGGNQGIFVELGVCDDPTEAQAAIETSKAETETEFPDVSAWESLRTDPSFYKVNTPRGAFISWTRGQYYFAAHARDGEANLDEFMRGFPY